MHPNLNASNVKISNALEITKTAIGPAFFLYIQINLGKPERRKFEIFECSKLQLGPER